MNQVVRIDRGLLRAPQRKGDALVIEGHAARVHGPSNPLRYKHGDEYRDAAELARIVRQLEGKPVVLRHPPYSEATKGLLSFGAPAKRVGRVDAAWIDGEHIAVRLRIDNAEGVVAIGAGMKELSLGYLTDVGDDRYQRDTEVDHIALEPRARCGGTCALRVDSVRMDCSDSCGCRAELDVEIDPSHETAESVRMSQDKDMPLDEQVRFLKAKNDELQTRVDSLDADAKNQKARADSFEQQLDVAKKDLDGERAKHQRAVEIETGEEHKRLTARADAADTELAKLRDLVPAMVNARAELLVRARTALGDKCRFDAATPDRVIEETIIKHYEPTCRTDGLSDAQVKSRADALYESRMQNAESLTRAAEILSTGGRETRLDSKENRAKAWREQATNPKGYRAAFGANEEA